MTRLQKMFLDLSECKTVKELDAKITPDVVDEFLNHLAFKKRRKCNSLQYRM